MRSAREYAEQSCCHCGDMFNLIKRIQAEAYEAGQRLAYKRIADDIGRDHPKTALAIYQLPIKPYTFNEGGA